MLSFPATVRVFVCLEPTDMRRSFDGLAAMVEQIIQADPFATGICSSSAIGAATA